MLNKAAKKVKRNVPAAAQGVHVDDPPVDTDVSWFSSARLLSPKKKMDGLPLPPHATAQDADSLPAAAQDEAGPPAASQDEAGPPDASQDEDGPPAVVPQRQRHIFREF